jgi:hypothetical protein
MTIGVLLRVRAELARVHVESCRHPNQMSTVLLNNQEIEDALHALDIVIHPPQTIGFPLNEPNSQQSPNRCEVDEGQRVKTGAGIRTWEEEGGGVDSD